MAALRVCFVAYVVLLCLFAGTLATDSPVVIVTSKTFDSTIGKGLWVIDFFAPWCGYCKQLVPIYAEAARQLKARNSPVQLATIDCVDPLNVDLCKNLKINAYPTLKISHDGDILREFEGPRTVENFLATADNLVKQFQPVEQTESATKEEPVASKNFEIQNTEGEVIELTSATFDQMIAEGPWLLEFFAPWCGHCKNLAPIWERLAEKTRGKLNVAKIDCTVQSGVCSRLGVKGYPTLKYSLGKGVIQNYQGARSFDALHEFANRMLSPAIVPIEAAELSEIRVAKPVAFFFLAANAEPLLSTALELVSSFALRSSFYFSADPKAATELGVSSLPALVVLRENEITKFEGQLNDHQAVRDWIDNHRMPLLPEFDSVTANDFLASPKKLVLLAIDPSETASETRHKAELKEAIRIYNTDTSNPPVNFAWLNGVYWSSYASRTFSINNLPGVVIADPINELYYDTTASGQPIALKAKGILSALADLRHNKLSAKYMGGGLSYFARMTGKLLERFADWVGENIWVVGSVTVLSLAGLFYYLANDSTPTRTEASTKKAE